MSVFILPVTAYVLKTRSSDEKAHRRGAGGYEPDAGLGAGLGEAGELGDEAGLITISRAS